ncbi:MAG: hypothetical protein ACYDHW_03855 [Syntrophorhabdaceae bacterium]
MCRLLRNERGGIVRWIFILIIAGAGFYGYQYFKTTPRYALIQFKKAIMLSDVDAAQRYMHLETVVRNLPDSITDGDSREILIDRLRRELDSPSNKGFFKRVRGWKVFAVPIEVSQNKVYALTHPYMATTVRLEKTTGDSWIITAIEVDEAQEEDTKAAQRRKEMEN